MINTLIAILLGLVCGLLIAEIFYDGFLMNKTRQFLEWFKKTVGWPEV